MRLGAALLASALGAAGCASIPDAPPTPALFAVVPAADGHVGKIVIYRPDGPRVIDTAYGGQRLDAEGRLTETRLTPNEIRETFALTLSALPPRPVTFTLYFLEGRDELTPESRAELERVTQELKLRPVPEIVLIGHTDMVGTAEYNDRLSVARAERAREMLLDLGIKAPRMEVAGRGKREPLVPTEDNVAEPRNRRVEINVR